MTEAAVLPEKVPLTEQTPVGVKAAHARKNSQLNSAAPDFVPKLRCSINRKVSGLDEVNFSPANGICTPSSTSCWYWDGFQWHVSPHMGGKASPGGSSWGSTASVLTPQTPQQGGPNCQQRPSPNSSDSISTDGCLASDGSMSGCSSSTPCPPALMLCAVQQPGPHPSPFGWPHSPQGSRPPPPSPMGYPCMGPPPGGPLAHGMVQHPHLPHGYMPAPLGTVLPGMLPPPSPLQHCLQSPLLTPHPQRRPPWHGGMAHGLPPLMMPPTPQYLCMQPPSPSYPWQPATPCQLQEPGPNWARQRHAAFTPRSAHRRPTRMGSSSIDSSESASPPGAVQTAPPPKTPMAAAPPAHHRTPAADKRPPLKELTIGVEPGGQPSPRTCSPMRKPSGISAADTQAIAAVLEKAKLLGDEVPKQVEELKALVSHDCQEPINARHRRTLRRATQRAAKALGMEQPDGVDASGNLDSLEGRTGSGGEGSGGIGSDDVSSSPASQ